MALRSRYPHEGKRTLARRIISRSNFVGEEAELASVASFRPFFSIYSVIRRHDRRVKAAGKAA